MAYDPSNRLSQISPEQLANLRKKLALKNDGAATASGAKEQPIPRCADEALVLSFGQERLWFLQLLEPRSAAYNISCAFRLTGALDVDRMVRAYHIAVARQEVLRTRILNENGRPVAVLSPEIPFMQVVSDSEEKLQHRISAEAQRPFSLDHEPMIRATLYRMCAEEHVLALTLHHSAADGWSVSSLLKDIVHAYGALAEDEAYELPQLPVRYADYAAWQRTYLGGGKLGEQIDFWKQYIGSTPLVLELPTDFPRPPSQSFRGSTGLPFAFEPSLMQRVREFARKQRTTLFSVLMAAYGLLISRYSGQQLFTIGVPVAGRGRPELDELCGFFANTLVIPCAVNPQWNFQELTSHIQRQVSAALAHPDVPFEKLLEELKPERDTSRSPLFQVLFAYQQFSILDLSVSGIQSSALPVNTGAAKFDLSFYLGVDGSKAELSVEYSTDLFRASTIERMVHHYSALLEQLVDHPQQSLGQVPLLTPAEQLQVLHSFNDTAMDYPREVSLAELFEVQVAKNPNATAVVFGKDSLSYQELNQPANQLARELAKRGVGPDKVVGILLDRSLNMAIALLAVLKSGAAYLPLDPHLPPARLAWMIEDSGLKVLITQRAFFSAVPAAADILLMDEAERWQDNSRTDLDIKVAPEQLAYLIYTSGSTGKPKGVQVSRGALLNLLWSARQRLNFASTDRLLAVTTISFDIAGVDFWLPLLSGAQIIVASREAAMDGWQLRTLIEKHAITFMQATPATWWLLLDPQWSGKPDLLAICTGEALPTELAERLRSRVSRLWNFYGPTETTIWSTAYEVENSHGSMLIGRPLGNTQCYILDSGRQPVPLGVTGELYIAGDGLARGYLNQPELTAAKFVENPFSQKPEARMYRTGDLARYLPDGNIDYLGRNDHQVKVRGFRIELGEIETALKRHPLIQQAVVIVREDTPNNQRLVAYFVASGGHQPDHSELRALLKQHLPDYMVPSDYVALNEMPLTPNGKIDRKTLPAPEGKRSEDQGYVAPRDAFEQNLCEAWAAVLGLDKVGIRDNFFDLGGHSLLAVQLWLRLQQILPGKQLPLSALLEAPTVELFAVQLRNANAHQHQLLLQMRPGSPTRSPFFCTHGRGGNVLNMRSLAIALPPDLPFYGLQAKGLDGSEPFASVEETARCYVDEIRRVQPHGPYYLGGICYGGLVAYEMARILEQLGEPVAALVLLDSRNPAFLTSLSKRERLISNIRFYARRAAWHARTVLSKPVNDRFEYLQGRCLALYEYLRKSLQEAAVATAEQDMAKVSGTPLGENLMRVIWANFLAAKEFVPKPYGGGALIIRAGERYLDPYDDYFLGWRALVRGTIECFEIDGDHMSILEQPTVQILADKLDAKFAELSAQWEAKQQQEEQETRELATA